LAPMRTRERPAAPAEAPPPSDRMPAHGLRSWAASAALVIVLAGAVSGFFLWIYPAKHFTVPIGWDQSEYLWRTKYAQVVGLTHIDEAPGSARSAKSGRPAFPVVTATISSLGGLSPFRVAVVLPSVMAAVIGLAAGAFIAGVLNRPPWQLAVVVLGLSMSPFLVRLMQPEGYMDNMFAAAVFLAAVIPLALAIEDRRALVPAILLLGAGATIHWAFFGFMGAVLVLCAVLYAPSSWRRWRAGEPVFDTPSARIGESLVGGAVVGTGMIFGVLGNGLPKPRVDVSEFNKKLQADIRKYKFAFSIPLAAGGAASLYMDSRDPEEPGTRTRFVLAFLVSWCLVVLAGYLAKIVLHIAIPAHRFLAFGLGIPLLGVVALVWAARRLERVNAVAAMAVVVVALAVVAHVAHDQWFLARTWTDPAKIEGVATAAAYLDAAHVSHEEPVVFIVGTSDWSTAALMGHTIRASVPADRIDDVYVYVGSADSFLAHRPEATKISKRYFENIAPVYARDPVAVIDSAFNVKNYGRWAAAHPDMVVDGRMAVVVGPPPPSPILASGPPIGPPLGRMSLVYVGVLAAFALGALLVVGWGWTVLLLRRWLGPLEILAAAPAVGVAALVMGGILVDRLGVKLVGVRGAATVVGIATAGWIAAWWFHPPRSLKAPPSAAATS
jgi:hypothetical protein